MITGAVRCLTALAAGGTLALAGCGGTDPGTAAPAGSATAGGGPVVVFAAASLTDVFTTIAEDLQRTDPGTRITFNFGASSALAQQIVSGAPADVFAAASPKTMETVTQAGDAETAQVFTRNRLQIAVPPDNPGQVSGLPDFAVKSKKIALCSPEVPCGAAAEKAFAAAGITPAPDTLEQDVRATLSKVQLGEVDAGLVYRTDVLAADGKVKGIDFPAAAEVINDYPIATLSKAPNPAGAQAFVDYVLSAEGQQVLEDAGFERP